MNDDRLRIGDAERDAAAADLGEHFAHGRLTAEEHDERLSSIWAAKTRGEIPPVFADLPSPYAAVASATSAGPPSARHGSADRYWNAGPRARWRGLPTPLLVVIAVLVALTVLTHLPLFLIGFGVFWFVVLRHRGGRWHGWHRRPGWH